MTDSMLTRRGLFVGGLTLMVAGCASAPRPEPIAYAAPQPELDPRFQRQSVRYDSPHEPGTIVVDTPQRFLYLVEENGLATRYGVGVAEDGLTMRGAAKVGHKAEWPSWRPTESMMKRKPRLLEYAGGVPGGPDNPLGARALYLYRDGRDTMFRLHGTNDPSSIGQAVSNGCIRLFNEDIIDLYNRTPVGTTVVVI